jgi:hypothetical protein
MNHVATLKVRAGVLQLTADDYHAGEEGLAPGDGRSQTQRDVLVKIVKILKSLPFVVPFDDRAAIFQRLIISSKEAVANPMDFGQGPNNFFDIRTVLVFGDHFSTRGCHWFPRLLT